MGEAVMSQDWHSHSNSVAFYGFAAYLASFLFISTAKELTLIS